MRFREVRVTGRDGVRVSALWLCVRGGISAAAVPRSGGDRDQTVPSVCILHTLMQSEVAACSLVLWRILVCESLGRQRGLCSCCCLWVSSPLHIHSPHDKSVAEEQRLKAKGLDASSVLQPSSSLCVVISGTPLNSCTAFAPFPVHSFSLKQTSEGGESSQSGKIAKPFYSIILGWPCNFISSTLLPLSLSVLYSSLVAVI